MAERGEGPAAAAPAPQADAAAQAADGDIYATGLATRRRVLGDAHVARAQAAESALDAAFQRLITEAAWGHVWSSDRLSLRERSLITLALLAGLGHWDEFVLHLRASANTGATARDIAEAMNHVAIYAGVPAANHALKLAKATLGEAGAPLSRERPAGNDGDDA